MPPSVNHLYVTARHGRRVLSTEGRKYKQAVKADLVPLENAPEWLVLKIVLYMPLRYKNGKVRRFDVSNRIKILEDALCEGMGIDDSRVRELVITKTDCEEYRVLCRVEEWVG